MTRKQRHLGRVEPPIQGNSSLVWLIVLAVGLCGLVYLPTLWYGFVWDDQTLITENPNLLTRNPLSFFGQGFWPGDAGQPYYRPLVILSFWLDRQVWGLRPSGFHFSNIVGNCLVGAMVAYLLWLMLSAAGAGARRWPALLGGVAFAFHPAHVESVAFVSGRTDILMTLFLLAALTLIVFVQQTRRGWLYLPAVAAFGLALLCKEAALLFPVLVLALLAPGWRDARARRRDFLLLAALCAVAVIYLLVRAAVLNSGPTPWAEGTGFQRVMLVVNGFGRYVFLAVVPFTHRLVVSDLASFTRVGPATALGVTGLVGLPLLGIAFRRSPLGLGSLLFVLFVLPASNILPLGSTYVAERALYLPSAGAILALACAAVVVAWTRAAGRLAAAGVGLYAVAMCASTFGQMPVWQSNQRLYPVLAAQAPGSGSAHYNLGIVLEQAGDVAGAEREYLRAAGLDRNLDRAWVNLGALRQRQGDFAGAMQAYRAALAIRPDRAETHYNIASLLRRQGNLEHAEQELRRALSIRPGFGPAQAGLEEILRAKSGN